MSQDIAFLIDQKLLGGSWILSRKRYLSLTRTVFRTKQWNVNMPLDWLKFKTESMFGDIQYVYTLNQILLDLWYQCEVMGKLYNVVPEKKNKWTRPPSVVSAWSLNA